jgi:hypothetical membrane protein
MKNTFLIILGIFLILSSTIELFNASKQIGDFNVGAFLGMICVWLFSYWLIRIGMGKRGIIDRKRL